MKDEIIEVTNCGNCPLLNEQYDDFWIYFSYKCNHPKIDSSINKIHEGKVDIVPDFCPLKQQSITIKLKDEQAGK